VGRSVVAGRVCRRGGGGRVAAGRALAGRALPARVARGAGRRVAGARSGSPARRAARASWAPRPGPDGCGAGDNGGQRSDTQTCPRRQIQFRRPRFGKLSTTVVPDLPNRPSANWIRQVEQVFGRRRPPRRRLAAKGAKQTTRPMAAPIRRTPPRWRPRPDHAATKHPLPSRRFQPPHHPAPRPEPRASTPAPTPRAPPQTSHYPPPRPRPPKQHQRAVQLTQ
jgi:hypothetical protein